MRLLTRQVHTEYAIFAAQPNAPHNVMFFMLERGIDFQVILGSYKGQRETSFCIPYNRLSEMVVSGLLDEQESVLVLGSMNGLGQRPVFFLTWNDDGEYVVDDEVSLLVETTRDKALAQPGWSYSIMARRFFIIQDQPA